jgi:hypothetical protein
MRKLSVFAAVLALFAGTAARLQTSRPNAPQAALGDVRLSNSGAFRDGLYLGGLTARRGGPTHIASGRWAFPADRALFVAGFQQGYHEVLERSQPK